MPVSYVAPTYYADHLAERGRKYLKPFLDGNDKNLETISRLYIDYVGTNDKCANARSRGFRQPSELAAALKSVKADKHAEASRVIWDAANVAFKADPFKGQSTSHRGPWQKALDNTMFWL
jgi:hypothetical protein